MRPRCVLPILAVIAFLLLTTISQAPLFSGSEEDAPAARAILTVGPGQTYSTIQTAINAANPGDTIQVMAGTYDEAVYVDKQLNLQGADRATTIIRPTSSPNSVVDFSSLDCRMENFTIRAGGDKRTGIYSDSHRTWLENITVDNLRWGIRLLGAENCTLRNVHSTDCEVVNLYYNYAHNSSFINVNISNSDGHGMGGDRSDNVRISDCQFYANADRGLYFDENTGLSVQNSSFRFNDIGLHLEESTSMVEYNSFQYSGYGGVVIWESSDNIHNNTFANCSIGIDTFGSYGAQFSDNDFTGGQYSDVRIDYVRDFTMRDNIMTGGGIYLYEMNPWDTKTVDIDASNFVNSLPVNVLFGAENITLDSTGRQHILLNCTNVTVKESTQDYCKCVSMAFCENVTVADSDLTATDMCVYAFRCQNTTIKDTTMELIDKDTIQGKGVRDELSTFTWVVNCTFSDLGFAVYGHWSDELSILNCTARNLTDHGFYFEDSTNCLIVNSSVENASDNGAFLYDCINIIVENSQFHNSTNSGIKSYYSNGNIIANSTITGTTNAIYWWNSPDGITHNNTMIGGGIVLLESNSLDYLSHIIDENNTVNGRPVYMRKLKTDETIPAGAGQVILVGCQDTLIENQNLSSAGNGAIILYSGRTTIRNVTSDHNIYGFHIEVSPNAVLVNCTARNCTKALEQVNSASSRFTDCIFSGGTFQGVYCYSSGNSVFTSCDISDNAEEGLDVYDSDTVIIQDCDFNNNGFAGLDLWTSEYAILYSNRFLQCGIGVMWGSYAGSHTIPENNTVNGKQIFYAVDEHMITVPPHRGQVILVECSGILVKDMILSRCTVGVMAYQCTDIDVINITANNNEYGIYVVYSYDVVVERVTANDCAQTGITLNCSLGFIHLCRTERSLWAGIHCFGSDIDVVGCVSNNNTAFGYYLQWGSSLYDSIAYDNKYIGVELESISNSGRYFKNNTILNTKQYGLRATACGGGSIYNNNLINNNLGSGNTQAYDGCLVNVLKWNKNGIGNYWSDWTGPDNNQDGVVDIPYNLTSWDGSRDTMPRTEPFTELVYLGDTTAEDGKEFLMVPKFWDYLTLADWSLHTNASWLSLEEDNSLQGVPGQELFGQSFYVNVTASFSFHSVFINFTVDVENANDAPFITTPNVETAYDGVGYWVQYNATDIDPTNDSLHWEVECDTLDMYMRWTTGLLSFLPDDKDIGVHIVNVSVRDDSWAYDCTIFNLTILNTPEPQRIGGNLYNDTALEDEWYTAGYIPVIEDLNETPGVFTLHTNAAFLSYNHSTNLQEGLPTNDDVGVYFVNLTLTDPDGLTDYNNRTLTVLNVNDPPEITNEEDVDLDANQYEEYRFNFTALDIDPTNDVLTWSMTSETEFLSINATSGSLNGTPGKLDEGRYDVNISVTDGNNGTDAFSFKLLVNFMNLAPVAREVDLVIQEDSDDNYYPLDLFFSDPEGDSLYLHPRIVEGLQTQFMGNMTLRIRPDTDFSGTVLLNLTANDVYYETSNQVTVVVTPVNDLHTASITSPGVVDTFLFGEAIQFRVEITDVDLLYEGDNYTVYWFSDINGQFANGEEAAVSTLEPGMHLIEVRVPDRTGYEVVDQMSILIEKEEVEPESNYGFYAILIFLLIIVILAIVLVAFYYKRTQADVSAPSVVQSDDGEVDLGDVQDDMDFWEVKESQTRKAQLTYYDLLGLTPYSSDKEIKRAYRKLAKKLHPDVSDEDREKMIKLNEVKMVLMDKKKRDAYDIKLGYYVNDDFLDDDEDDDLDDIDDDGSFGDDMFSEDTDLEEEYDDDWDIDEDDIMSAADEDEDEYLEE